MKKTLLLLILLIPNYFFSQCPESISFNPGNPILEIFTTDELENFVGSSVSISGDYCIIGEVQASVPSNTSFPGSVRMYKRQGENTWALTQQIFPDNGENNIFFGFAVALSGNYAIVGSTGNNPGNFGPGAVYIYERNVSDVWEFKNQFDYPGTVDVETTGFGTAVSISSNGYAVVGSNYDSTSSLQGGSAYVYKRLANEDWEFQQRLTAESYESNNGSFGISVDITDCDEIAVGAYQEFNDGMGKLYIYKQTNTIWSQDARLEASNGANGDGFGHSISFSENKIATIAKRGGNGTVYVYENVNGSWNETILEASSLSSAINFVPGPGLGGHSLSLKGNTLLVSEAGVAAHLIEKTNGNWTFVNSILPTSPQDSNGFARFIEMDSDSAVLSSGNRGRIFENNTILGVSEINNIRNKTVNVFPNPVINEYVNIKLLNNDELSKVRVYNISGQLILDINQFDSNKIYLGNLQPGVYFMKVNTSVISKKVIIL